MPSYCNWHRGPVQLDGVERTCHSDKQDFILLAKDGSEVRIPAAYAVALRDNLNDYIRLGEGYPAARVLEMEGENARLKVQLSETRHKLQTMQGVLTKTLNALD